MERPQNKFWPLVFPQRGLLALTFSTAFGLWAIVALKSLWKHQGLWIKVVKMSIVPNPTLQDAVYRSKSNIAGLFLSLVESWTWAGTLVIPMEVVTRWTSCVPPLWVVIFKKTNVVNFCVLLDIQNLRTRLSNFFLKTQQRSGKQRTRGSSRVISSHCLKVHPPHILLLIGMLCKSVRLVDLFNVLCLSVRVSKLSEGMTCDDRYYSSVQPVVVGVFFLLSWSIQRCCACRSHLIVGRSDLRRLLLQLCPAYVGVFY